MRQIFDRAGHTALNGKGGFVRLDIFDLTLKIVDLAFKAVNFKFFIGDFFFKSYSDCKALASIGMSFSSIEVDGKDNSNRFKSEMFSSILSISSSY